MIEKRVLVRASGEGLKKLMAEGVMSETFIRATREDEGINFHLCRSHMSIEAGCDSFCSLVEAAKMPEPFNAAFSRLDKCVNLRPRRRSLMDWIREALGVFNSDGTVPVVQMEAAVEGYPDTTVTIEGYAI